MWLGRLSQFKFKTLISAIKRTLQLAKKNSAPALFLDIFKQIIGIYKPEKQCIYRLKVHILNPNQFEEITKYCNN